MGHFHNPPPPPFMGGRQPHAPRQLSPGVPGQWISPPPGTRPGQLPKLQQIASVWQPDPWTYSFFGARQPFEPRKISPGVPGQQINNPPFMLGGPIALKLEAVAIAQPDPWTYSFFGARQPFDARKISPGVPGQWLSDPPFTYGGPLALKLQGVAVNQPDWSFAAWPYVFMGARQPYAPRTIAPGVPGQSITNPPFTLGGPYALKLEAIAIAQPDPWTYAFIGSSQPYGPKRRSSAIPGQSVENPPFTLGGPYALKLEAIAVNQPAWSYTAWPFVFMGNRQPYTPRLLPLAVTAVTVSPFPFSHRARTAAHRAIVETWQPPPFDFQMQLYATRPSPQRLRPSARGYIIL